jgi:hypothetical protein
MSNEADLLTAVTLDVLVRSPQTGLTLVGVTRAVQRDPAASSELQRIEAILHGLVEDGLAQRDGEYYRGTRAAIRAYELRF